MLLGGSKGKPKKAPGKSFFANLFHDNIPHIRFREQDTHVLRLLPAFDTSLNKNDGAYYTSYVPYRDTESGEVDPDTKTPAFTSWFFPVDVYVGVGRSRKCYISPTTVKGEGFGVSPIDDCRIYAYQQRKKEDNDYYVQLMEKTKKAAFKSKDAEVFVPNSSVKVLANAYIENPKTRKSDNRIIVFSEGSLTDLKEKLSLRAGRNDEVITKGFEDFLYGDVTDPETGMLAFVVNHDYGNFSTPSFFFTTDDKGEIGDKHSLRTPKGDKAYEIVPVGEDILNKRYDISDTENVTKIATYEELLDVLVNDSDMPYEWIEEACSDTMKVPQRKNATHSTPNPKEEKKSEEDKPSGGLSRRVRSNYIPEDEDGNEDDEDSEQKKESKPSRHRPQSSSPAKEEEDDVPFDDDKSSKSEDASKSEGTGVTAEEEEFYQKVVANLLKGETPNGEDLARYTDIASRRKD